MTRARSIRAALLAPVAAGLLAAPTATTPAHADDVMAGRVDLSGVSLTAEPSARRVDYGDDFAVSGTLASGNPEGPRVSGVIIELVWVANVSGDMQNIVLTKARTDESGRYETEPYAWNETKQLQVWARFTNGTGDPSDDQLVKRWLGDIAARAVLKRATLTRSPGAVISVNGYLAPRTGRTPPGSNASPTIDLFAGRRGDPLVFRGSYPIKNRAYAFALSRTLAPGIWNVRLKYNPGNMLPGYYSGAAVLR